MLWPLLSAKLGYVGWGPAVVPCPLLPLRCTAHRDGRMSWSLEQVGFCRIQVWLGVSRRRERGTSPRIPKQTTLACAYTFIRVILLEHTLFKVNMDLRKWKEVLLRVKFL